MRCVTAPLMLRRPCNMLFSQLRSAHGHHISENDHGAATRSKTTNLGDDAVVENTNQMTVEQQIDVAYLDK